MINVYVDIETIPSQKPGLLAEIRAGIQPPGNISKPETIAKWMDENADAAAEEAYRKTAFDGALGEIICIGYAFNDELVDVICRRSIEDSETDLLRTFFHKFSSTSHYTFIGHNIIGFDLRFLFQRAVTNRVQPLYPLPVDSRYNGDRTYDTMLGWAGWGNRVKLSKVCDALGIPVKTGGIDGSMVWDAVRDGRIDEVAEYCKEDVAAVRSVHRRMTFS